MRGLDGYKLADGRTAGEPVCVCVLAVPHRHAPRKRGRAPWRYTAACVRPRDRRAGRRPRGSANARLTNSQDGDVLIGVQQEASGGHKKRKGPSMRAAPVECAAPLPGPSTCVWRGPRRGVIGAGRVIVPHRLPCPPLGTTSSTTTASVGCMATTATTCGPSGPPDGGGVQHHVSHLECGHASYRSMH